MGTVLCLTANYLESVRRPSCRNVVLFLAIDDDISRKLHLLSPYKTMLFKEQLAQIHQNKYLARFCHLFSLKVSVKIFPTSCDTNGKSDEERH